METVRVYRYALVNSAVFRIRCSGSLHIPVSGCDKSSLGEDGSCDHVGGEEDATCELPMKRGFRFALGAQDLLYQRLPCTTVAYNGR